MKNITFETQEQFQEALQAILEIDCAWYQSPDTLDDHMVINAVGDNQLSADDGIHFNSTQLEIRFNTKSIQNKLKYNKILRELLNANYITDYVDENEWYYTVYSCVATIIEL